MVNWHSNISSNLLVEDYDSVIHYYEALIEQEPDNIIHCWYLGLAYLLNADEESAQTIWMMAIAQSPESETDELTQALITVLHQEAEQQFFIGNIQKSWLIRFHIREINPIDLSNILTLLQLDIELKQFTPDCITHYELCNILENSQPDSVISQELFKTLEKVLQYPAPECINLAKCCLRFAEPIDQWIVLFVTAATNIGYYLHAPRLGIELIQLCLQLKPNAHEAWEHLPRLHLEANQYKEAIQTATEFYSLCTSVDTQFFSNALLLKSMLSAGAWAELDPIAHRHNALLHKLIETQPDLTLSEIKSLLVYTGCNFYLRDSLKDNRGLQNESAKLFQKNLVKNTAVVLPLCHSYRAHSNKQLKIGYIAHTLRSHSVGWLSRWLFKYHDRNTFDLSLYLFAQDPNDSFFREWFAPNVNAAHFFVDDIPAAAEKIRDDAVDILIDLDSLTLDHTATVIALKPAPIQATWLGWDASGLPTVDYFIADPYVLPEDAQKHYQEKIIRLPQTYIAVNGFETDVPTIKRTDLGISGDRVVYYSAQVGMKRHPANIQLQLQIIQAVPNSYLLVKGLADETIIQEMFLDLAADLNIAAERLKFLPIAPTEMVHRANLSIADIVLDTFPYNGATTTLETLWMGIPLVTRVGTQFAARNSYAFLMNVGVTEGIAWSADEYVEWGIRFGQDLQLRQEVAWKLRQSRKTSPLWNSKQFTLDMEHAYQTMWQNYLEDYG